MFNVLIATKEISYIILVAKLDENFQDLESAFFSEMSGTALVI